MPGLGVRGEAGHLQSLVLLHPRQLWISAGKSKTTDILGKFLTFSPSGWARSYHESSLSSGVLVFLFWEPPQCRQSQVFTVASIAHSSAGHEGWHKTHLDPSLCTQASKLLAK